MNDRGTAEEKEGEPGAQQPKHQLHRLQRIVVPPLPQPARGGLAEYQGIASPNPIDPRGHPEMPIPARNHPSAKICEICGSIRRAVASMPVAAPLHRCVNPPGTGLTQRTPRRKERLRNRGGERGGAGRTTTKTTNYADYRGSLSLPSLNPLAED